MARPSKYNQEFRDRAVRLVLEQREEYPSPESISARRTHLRNVSAEPMPSFAATERIASNSTRSPAG